MVDKVQCVIFKYAQRPMFLVLHRTKEKGGYWQNVTGSVEKGETDISAAKREVKEETTISEDSIIKIYDLFTFTFQEPGKEKKEEKVYAFLVKLDVDIDLSKNVYTEHTEYEWADADAAVRLIKWESNKKAISETIKKISG